MTIALFWTLLSVIALARQLHTWREARLDVKAIGPVSNGREIVAKEQIEAAWQHALIQLLFLSCGVIALLVPLPVDERPELSFRAVTLPILLICAQITAVVRHERAAGARRRLLRNHPEDISSTKAEEIRQTVVETRQDVKQIKEEGVRVRKEYEDNREEARVDRVARDVQHAEEQEAEERDHGAGRTHRGFIDEYDERLEEQADRKEGKEHRGFFKRNRSD